MEKLQTAKMLAKLEGVNFQHRDLVGKWILITYDLPVTDEGNRIRYEFLKKAPQIGAVMQNRSVYLMPLTKATEMAALQLSKAYNGSVYVWTSSAMDEEINKQLTELYDRRINEEISDIKSRIRKINDHIKEEKFRFAKMMVKKTVTLFNNALYGVAQRGDKKAFHELESLYSEIVEIQERI